MRVDEGGNRLASMRARLGVPTPCPECSDSKRDTYCDTCVLALADVLGESLASAKRAYGRKRWPIATT